MSLSDELLEQKLDALPRDGEVSDEERRAAADEVTAVRLLRSMLLAYRPAAVVEALRIAYRLLRGCSSPEVAAKRLGLWREERMAAGGGLSEAELLALSVAGTIAGVGS